MSLSLYREMFGLSHIYGSDDNNTNNKKVYPPFTFSKKSKQLEMFQTATRCPFVLIFLLYSIYVSIDSNTETIRLPTPPVSKFFSADIAVHEISPDTQPKVKKIPFHIE
jgi:hypothetical protein